jgi:catechol 2,3-dioxygenase-like lactoylglutathione lyase family enzyme
MIVSGGENVSPTKVENVLITHREDVGDVAVIGVPDATWGEARDPSGKLLERRDRHAFMEILASRMLIRPVDYQRSLQFYRDRLDLAIARDYGAGTVFYAGQSLIELAGHGEPSAGGTMWLQVRDVYATEEELKDRGVEIAREATQEPWGLHEMHVVDPDGVLLIFVQVPENHPLRRDTRQ